MLVSPIVTLRCPSYLLGRPGNAAPCVALRLSRNRVVRLEDLRGVEQTNRGMHDERAKSGVVAC